LPHSVVTNNYITNNYILQFTRLPRGQQPPLPPSLQYLTDTFFSKKRLPSTAFVAR